MTTCPIYNYVYHITFTWSVRDRNCPSIIIIIRSREHKTRLHVHTHTHTPSFQSRSPVAASFIVHWCRQWTYRWIGCFWHGVWLTIWYITCLGLVGIGSIDSRDVDSWETLSGCKKTGAKLSSWSTSLSGMWKPWQDSRDVDASEKLSGCKKTGAKLSSWSTSLSGMWKPWQDSRVVDASEKLSGCKKTGAKLSSWSTSLSGMWKP